RERACDAAILDEERPVARGAGHGRALRIRSVRVMEARDEHAMRDAPDELLARRVAAGHGEVGGVPARTVAARVRGVSRARGAEPAPGLTVVHDAARDPLLDQRDPPLRGPLDVERDRERTRVEGVLPEREARPRHLLADAPGHERAAVAERLPGEPDE